MSLRLWKRCLAGLAGVILMAGVAGAIPVPTGYNLFPGVNADGNLDASLPGSGLAIVQYSLANREYLIRARASVPNEAGIEVVFSNGQTLALCNDIADESGHPTLVADTSLYQVRVARRIGAPNPATLIGSFE